MSSSKILPVLQYSSACITLEAVVDRPKGKSHTTQILVSVPSHSSMAMGREAGLMHTVRQPKSMPSWMYLRMSSWVNSGFRTDWSM